MFSIASVMSESGTEAELRAQIEARNTLVVENQGLIHQVARGFHWCEIPLPDLIQFGNLGLIRAAEKFEPERGLKFSTYAIFWIRQSIYKGILNTAGLIRLPLHARKEAKALQRRLREMEAESGTRPELTDALDAMEAGGEIRRMQRARLIRAAEAVDARPDARPGGKPMDEVVIETRPEDSPLSACILGEHREQLNLALPLLDEIHRLVLIRRYGLDGSPPAAICTVARSIGITWRKAEKIEYEAILAIRKYLNR